MRPRPLLAVGALLAAAGGAAGSAAAEPYGAVPPLAGAELALARGGVFKAGGVEFSFAVSTRTVIEGALELATTLRADGTSRMEIGMPDAQLLRDTQGPSATRVVPQPRERAVHSAAPVQPPPPPPPPPPLVAPAAPSAVTVGAVRSDGVGDAVERKDGRAPPRDAAGPVVTASPPIPITLVETDSGFEVRSDGPSGLSFEVVQSPARTKTWIGNADGVLTQTSVSPAQIRSLIANHEQESHITQEVIVDLIIHNHAELLGERSRGLESVRRLLDPRAHAPLNGR